MKTIKEFTISPVARQKIALALSQSGTPVYLGHYQGSGKWAKFVTWGRYLEEFAKTHGINYTVSNNGPRGGQAHTFICYHF